MSEKQIILLYTKIRSLLVHCKNTDSFPFEIRIFCNIQNFQSLPNLPKLAEIVLFLKLFTKIYLCMPGLAGACSDL